MASGTHPATGLLRPKQPPHLSPTEIREAQAEGKALDPDQDLLSDEVLAQYEQLRLMSEWGSEMPVPTTQPSPFVTEKPPPPTRLTRGHVIVGTMSSTKDPFQNVDNPETQERQRVKQIESAAKRRADNQVRTGGGDLVEAIRGAHLLSEAETASIREQQSLEWLDRERALRLEPDLPTDVVMISDTEETPVGEEIVPLAEADAESWLAIKDQVVDWADGIHDRLSMERFCRITVELRAPDNKLKPDHLVEALDWLVKRGQGAVTDAWVVVKPEHRCAQYLTDDGCYVRFEFADMDAATHPSLTQVVNIGRIA